MNRYRQITTIAVLSFINLVSFAQLPALMLPIGHTDQIVSAEFSPDGKKIITLSADGTAKSWETSTGKLLRDFKEGGDASRQGVVTAKFSPDGKKIVISYGTHSSIVDISSGKTLWDWLYDEYDVPSKDILKHFSPDGKRIVLFELENTATIYTTDTLKKAVLVLKGHNGKIYRASYSPDGKKIITASQDSTIKIWDAATAKLLMTFKKQDYTETFLFSPDSKKIIVISEFYEAKVLDAITGKQINNLAGFEVDNAGQWTQFSPDGKLVLKLSLGNQEEAAAAPFVEYCERINMAAGNSIWNYYDKLEVWNVLTGKSLYRTDKLVEFNNASFFSPDGKIIITPHRDGTVKIREATTGKFLFSLSGHTGIVNSARFSPDGKKIITASMDNTVKVWYATTGKLITNLVGHSSPVNDARFSPDGKKIVTASGDRSARIWNLATGKQTNLLKGRTNELLDARFSPDSSKIIFYSKKGRQVWDFEKGSFVNIAENNDTTSFNNRDFSSSVRYSPDSLYQVSWGVDIFTLSEFGTTIVNERLDEIINNIRFSPDSKKLLITLQNNTVRLFDIRKNKFLFTFISVDSADYLIADAKSHYDGSPAARKLLHFTCGDEVVTLDQVKDQLWVPNLASRIYKGESINAKSLEELNIWHLTPLVEEIKGAATEYRFKITPRRGGIGEMVVYVNGIEAKRYKPTQLQKKPGGYELAITRKSLDSFFVAGTENPVTVTANTSDNTYSSRGFTIEADKTNQTKVTPNLYAVMIGVSDYKGDELDLQYAAKDAEDFSNALSIASRRLLNDTNGKEHVFIYNLTTTAQYYLLPEKNSIKKTLQEISTKATANDMLVIFFAGHGVMQGVENKKQFYFLTAEASTATATSAIANVAISMNELTEWIKPANIKAQKRILIFDACNSGQAIKDFVQFGKAGQGFVAARNDEKAQQIKAIEKLNNQSGLFILAASASNQRAYEMGRYSQGLLTYSLLKAIKQQPDILENGKYLDVSNWLNAAKKTVTILAEESGERQEPQLNANNNFNIGLVDEAVRSKIILSDAKPLFSRSNFMNSDTKTDNLKLRSTIDKQLINISAGKNAPITYSGEYEGDDAYSLTGDYKITGENVTVTTLITKGGVEVHRYETKGKVIDTEGIALSITGKVKDWLNNH